MTRSAAPAALPMRQASRPGRSWSRCRRVGPMCRPSSSGKLPMCWCRPSAVAASARRRSAPISGF
jgi:hypothetical protein